MKKTITTKISFSFATEEKKTLFNRIFGNKTIEYAYIPYTTTTARCGNQLPQRFKTSSHKKHVAAQTPHKLQASIAPRAFSIIR